MEEWLKSIGLDERVEAFRAHRIQLEDLAALTEPDLRELGLTIGERKRFRRGVAATPPVDLPAVESPAPVPARTLPERRPLTVAFIDLVGSTSLSERLDVEDMLEVIRLYRELCGAAISRYGGHVVRFVGDGILAYFCYPVAHENDPERAMRAALDIVRDVGRLVTPAGIPLEVRIGAATGRVVVSDLFAGGLADVQSIVGSTPNLAARLQTLAAANGIVISEATYQRIQGLFETVDEGLQDLKGFAVGQRAFRLVGELATGQRASGKPPSGRLTPLFGRDDELEQLEACWQRARERHGETVLLLGEPGIGKSRLAERFVSARQREGARIVSLNASALDEDSPLHPLMVYFREQAGFERGDAPDVRGSKLRAVLRGSPAERALAVPVLSELLGLPPAGQAGESLAPSRLKERMLGVLVDQLAGLAEEAPLCVIVEDAHWLDPTSRDLFARLAQAIAARRMLLLVTAREGPSVADWIPSLGASATIRLKRLDARNIVGMVQSLFGDEPVPAHVARQIARKTDGVPLFVEEFIRPLVDRPTLVDWSRIDLDETGPASIPASLHGAFMARLDHSGSAKEVAQIAAVIGRVAPLHILAAVAELTDARLEDDLAALRRAGVLYPEDIAGRPHVAFGHALVRDAAYDGILRDRRRELHARVAEAMRRLDPDAVEQQPELLALHLSEGGLVADAVPYWTSAARRSLSRSALLEATRLLQRGLAAMATLPQTTENLQQRVEFAGLLGPALIALRGPGSAEARELYGTTYDLCLKLPEDRKHFPVYWGWWRMARDCKAMNARAGALLRRARRSEDAGLLLQAHHCNWASRYDVGDLAACCSHVEAGLAIYRKDDYRDHAVLYGNHDAKVCAHGELAQVYWMQGRLRQAMAESRQSRAWAEELRHVGSTTHAMDMALLHQTYRRDHRAVLDLADEFIRFAAEHGFADHRSKGLIFRGWATCMMGETARGLDLLETGLARQKEIGTSEDFPIYCCLQAEALAASGRPDLAVGELERGLQEFEAIGLKIWLPEVLRTHGDMLVAAQPGDPAPAVRAYRDAALLAEEQGALMLGLRVATSQARLFVLAGDVETAADVLRTARSRIAEDDGGSDLFAADALLDRVEREAGRPLCPGGLSS